MLVDHLERALLGGKGHVSNGREHDNAANHGKRLNPEKIISSYDSQIKGSSQGSSTQSNGSLQPAGAGNFGVSEEFSKRPLVLHLFDDIQFALVLVFFAHVWMSLVNGGAVEKEK